VRPGSLLEDADLDAERKTIETKLERNVSDFEFASYLMYPKVFTDFALASDTYGPVSVLPTPAYFYGLADGEELFARYREGQDARGRQPGDERHRRARAW
jgi:pyruvate carboxylase